MTSDPNTPPSEDPASEPLDDPEDPADAPPDEVRPTLPENPDEKEVIEKTLPGDVSPETDPKRPSDV